MAEEEIIGAVSSQVGQFQNVSQLLASSLSLQIAFAVLIVGLIIISIVYRKFSFWVRSQQFSYSRPHAAKFARVAILPFFAIALISSTNAYIQTSELFTDEAMTNSIKGVLTAEETFAKILNTINILVIGYTIANLIPIVLNKREKTTLEYEDYLQWKDMGGFSDDEGNLFHKLFKWIPPTHSPEEIEEDEFQKHLQTDEGKKFLENFRTSKGLPIGSYEQLVKDPYEEWKQSERAKYEKYFQDCTSGNNQSGRKLKAGQKIEEIYQIDIWREEKRLNGYDAIISGARSPGYAEKKREGIPKSFKQILPIGIFVAVIIGVIGWWGVDLFVLATATGGLAIGIGFALQETMQNYFAYIMIRKDKIFSEGDRVQLDTGYNGYVHKITPRVTYVRHALNESFAIIPTRQLVSAQIVNYSKELKIVPAVIEVGVSYLNKPRQVAAILVKVGKRAMTEIKDSKGRHMIVQKRCPYIDENKASCGCDKNVHVDLDQPTVRFNNFNDSALDFSVWVYVGSYGAQFKVKTDLRLMIYEEFKKYDIRIPWPIRTVYQGDEKRETEEIDQKNDERKQIVDDYGIGDLHKGDGDE